MFAINGLSPAYSDSVFIFPPPRLLVGGADSCQRPTQVLEPKGSQGELGSSTGAETGPEFTPTRDFSLGVEGALVCLDKSGHTIVRTGV